MSGTTSGIEFQQVGDQTNIKIFRGKTLNFEVIWGGASPIDITGYSAQLQMRDYNGAVMLDLNVGNGGIVVDGPNGKLTIGASPAQTDTVATAGRYELEMTNQAGAIYRVISGSVSPVDDIVQ